jgi:hypothetical protein
MLSREIFEQGLEEVEVAFSGFVMTKIKADIWYKYSKDLTSEQWLKKISNCIKGCARIPTLADILDWRGYHINQKEEENLRIKRQEIEHNKRKEKRGSEPANTKGMSVESKIIFYETMIKLGAPNIEEYRKKLKELEGEKK